LSITLIKRGDIGNISWFLVVLFFWYENIFLFSGSDLQSGGSSPCGDNSADGDDFIQHLRAQIDPTQLSQLTKSKLINDTLFDEGLRIAQN
jgi:hypothetical protein